MKTLNSRFQTDQQLANFAISCLDLTSLNETDDKQLIQQLCQRAAQQPHTAAVCVFPAFIAIAKATLAEESAANINVATVVNFPSGSEPIGQILDQVRFSITQAVDEIDLVMPWQAFLDGDHAASSDLIAAVRAACPDQSLKVILETGELKNPQTIRAAAELALKSGADFIKTSTGKVSVNATLEAAEIMLKAIQKIRPQAGFKAAGGISTFAEAKSYLQLASEICGADWVQAKHFRFGASSLLTDLQHVAKITNTQAPANGDNY